MQEHQGKSVLGKPWQNHGFLKKLSKELHFFSGFAESDDFYTAKGHDSALIQAHDKCYVGSGWPETGVPAPLRLCRL